MNDLLKSFFETPFATFITAGVIVGGIAYLTSVYRKNATSAALESNDILRKLIEDQRGEIANLKSELDEVKTKLNEIVSRWHFSEEILTKAASEYFHNHPDVLPTVKQILKGKK